jgi:MFS family permease
MLRLPAVWTTNASALLIGWATYAGFVLVPQYVEAPVGAGYGFGSSVTSAGFFLLPWTIAMFVASWVSGRMSSLVGSKWPLVIGSIAAMAAFVFLAFAHAHPWEIYTATGFVGAGVGLAFASLANLVVESVPQTETSVATGTNIIMRTVGGVIGTQVAVSIVASHVTAPGLPAERGYVISFVISAVALCVATFVALRAPAGAAHRRLSLERRRPAPAD